MRIGIIGTGFAGRAKARLAIQRGMDVMLSNGRDPSTLANTMIRCKIGTADEAAAFGDVVLIDVPSDFLQEIAPGNLIGKVVIDAGNDHCGQQIEGKIGSEIVAAHFPEAFVVKTFNTINDQDIEKHARPTGAPIRRALPMAGDAAHAKEIAAKFLDELGFDTLDAGPLAEAWRFEPGRPACEASLDITGLREALAAVSAEAETVRTV